MSVLKALNLQKTYDNRPVVRSVSIEIKTGEIVGLLGPNGAGKTTCFYMITGLVTPDIGNIDLSGRDITQLPMYQRARLGIGYLPQEASIFRGMTVEQNIMTILEIVEEEHEERVKRLDDLLAEFSITHLKNASALVLSGGERRRLEIARCLATNPKFVLLDEPLAGIDPIAVGDIKNLIYHLKDRGIGVLITDHNVRDTLDIVDRAYVISDGQMIMSGSPKEVVKSKLVKSVYLGETFSI